MASWIAIGIGFPAVLFCLWSMGKAVAIYLAEPHCPRARRSVMRRALLARNVDAKALGAACIQALADECYRSGGWELTQQQNGSTARWAYKEHATIYAIFAEEYLAKRQPRPGAGPAYDVMAGCGA